MQKVPRIAAKGKHKVVYRRISAVVITSWKYTMQGMRQKAPTAATQES